MKSVIQCGWTLAAVLAAAAWPALAAEPDVGSQAQGTANKATKAGKETGEKAILDKLHRANQMEIDMGGMAESQSSNDAVKDFAKRLVSDHQKADAQVSSVAQSKDVTLSSGTSAAESKKMDSLKGLTGKAFDRAYLSQMVAGHNKVIKAAEAAKTTFKSDDQLSSLLNDLLPTLKAHRDEAQRLMPAQNAARRAPQP